MKKVSPLLVVLLFVALHVVGQQKNPMPDATMLIALKDGSVIYPELIKPMALPLRKPYLRIDSQYSLPSEEVKYYKNGDAYYFWAEVSETGEGELLRLHEKGNVNTFFRNTVEEKPATTKESKNKAAQPDFFQVGNGPIRRITYENLATALSDNQASASKLKEVHKLNKTNRICLIAGGSMLVAGIAHSIKLNHNNTKPAFIETGLDTRLSPFLLLGAITVAVPIFNKPHVEKKTMEAIALYNK